VRKRKYWEEERTEKEKEEKVGRVGGLRKVCVVVLGGVGRF
jgi:hypothetical protein